MNKELREMDIDNKFIRFSIKADDTEENQKVHDAFKEFCKVECDDNYTQGLRKLLEYYQEDFKFTSIWDRIGMLSGEVEQLKIKLAEPQKKQNSKDINEVF